MTVPRVLFLVEGNTDIRFVTGLSEICDLTMAVPANPYNQSGLKQRVESSGARLRVDQIPGSRLKFQFLSFLYALRRARDFDVILCQEVLRGAFSGTFAGLLTRTPVVTYMGISPIEYFRCRRERRQIGPLKAWFGEAVIRSLMTFNGMFATKCLAMGPYLRDIAADYCPHSEVGLYYGVDTEVSVPQTTRSARNCDRSAICRSINSSFFFPAGLATKRTRRRCFRPRLWPASKD
jgi:hypothetical protein